MQSKYRGCVTEYQPYHTTLLSSSKRKPGICAVVSWKSRSMVDLSTSRPKCWRGQLGRLSLGRCITRRDRPRPILTLSSYGDNHTESGHFGASEDWVDGGGVCLDFPVFHESMGLGHNRWEIKGYVGDVKSFVPKTDGWMIYYTYI